MKTAGNITRRLYVTAEAARLGSKTRKENWVGNKLRRIQTEAYSFTLTMLIKSRFENNHFRPEEPTSSWKRGDVVLCIQSIPKQSADFDYHLGFFIGEHRLDDGYWGEYVCDSGQPAGVEDE